MATVSFNLPTVVIERIKAAALKRPDLNKSAELTDILVEHFEIELSQGGETAEKETIPA